MVGIVTQVFNTFIGVALGVTAGYFRWTLGRFCNRLHKLHAGDPIPDFCFGDYGGSRAGLISLLIALGLTNWSYTCRIARSQALSLAKTPYVQAARTLGYGPIRIMVSQILPNMLGPVIVIATLGMGSAILAEAALSFLGLGVKPPAPSWGGMLSDARETLQVAPWASIFPGLAIFGCVLGLTCLAMDCVMFLTQN